MNREDRAKQFIPFDALKGLQEELRIREERRTRVNKRQLCDEVIEQISAVLARVTVGSRIRVKFFSRGHYPDVEGDVTEISGIGGYLKLGDERIYFDDILKIRIVY